MKKISTAAAKATKNFNHHKLTIGLDLGDRSSWYCVLDEAGGRTAGISPIFRARTFPKVCDNSVPLGSILRRLLGTFVRRT